MLHIKQKLLSSLMLFALTILPLAALLPQTVYADHDGCFGLSTIGSDTAACTAQKRDIANRTCYARNEGNNTAIAECVRMVTAHFTYSGDPADAPPLPSDASASFTPSGSTKNVVDNADCKVEPEQDLTSDNCRIVYWINIFVNILSVLVGIVVTAMIILGGIQYTAAGADPNAVAKAKKQIFNAIFALIAYGLMYALLQYLIPGGLL